MAASMEMCVPGQRICAVSGGNVAGSGTYVRDGFIYASLAGYVNRTFSDDKMLHVAVSNSLERSMVPSVGNTVIARVTRVTSRFCRSLILAINDVLLKEPFHGYLRKEDVRAKEKDQVEMHKCFRPGDIIVARVLALGDALSYVLTTAENELGVVIATSPSGEAMVPISWCEMQCPVTFDKEFRKVARAQPCHCRQQQS